MEALTKKYRTFHGKEPKKLSSVNLHIPEGLILLGKAIAIEYHTDKKNGGGNGKPAIYRHEFERPTKLYMDEKARRQLYIVGNELKVTSAGIEN